MRKFWYTIMNMKQKKPNNVYYNVHDDIRENPDCWCFIVNGGRNTGKTYGALKGYLESKEPIVFTKRSNEDVDTICAGNSLGKKAASYEVDFSPYKAINRDLHTDIKAFKIKNGLGGFYHTTEEGAQGAPISYLVSLFAVSKIKGFDLSDAGALIFDEYAPQPWERINRKEGEQLMDLYKTIARDRHVRGKEELKLICLANSVNLFNPTCEILELTDIMAEMAARGQEVYKDPERGIFIRLLKTSPEIMEAEQKTGIYRSMKDTAWGRMAFENEFGYNDFSRIRKVALKGYMPQCSIAYKNKTWYIYLNDAGNYYMTTSANRCGVHYNLNTETGQRAFYYDKVLDVMDAAIENRAWFEKYTMYDLIMNFKKRFNI